MWVGKELYTRYETANKHKRNAFIVGGVTASVSQNIISYSYLLYEIQSLVSLLFFIVYSTINFIIKVFYIRY